MSNGRLTLSLKNYFLVSFTWYLFPGIASNVAILFRRQLKSIQCNEGISVTQIGRFLEFLGNKFYYKSSPNVLWLFGQLWNPLLFKSNCWCYILGNFWKNLGYFLFQHLVTLLEVVWKKNKCEREFPSSLFFQRETI